MSAEFVVNVEICLLDSCASTPAAVEQIRSAAQKLFAADAILYWEDRLFRSTDLTALVASSPAAALLVKTCSHIRCSLPPQRRGTCVWKHEARAAYFIYQLSTEGATDETVGDDDNDGGDQTVVSHQWMLPNVEFEGIWDSLILEPGVQDSLLDYAQTALHFSDAGVDENIVSWNRLVLLHGPPGTGKTSLCKALAQKLSIRLSHRYAATVLLEINAHSLFSKWFSESGKLVLKLFEQIRNMLEQEDCLFCVLMDEVESLTAARQAALSGSEPSDAIRVVNALLTQLDRLKRYRNVLILTTSNITDAIDTAFVDRADIKQYIGSPSAAAIHEILRSCVTELARKGLVTIDPKSRGVLPWGDVPAKSKDNENDPSRMLADIATLCATHQFSGRTLRKLPFQSFARFCQGRTVVDLLSYLRILQQGVQFEIDARASMKSAAKALAMS